MAPSLERPSFDLEDQLQQDGRYPLIAGTDEVGRGSIAGPVAAAAVVFPARFESDWIQAVDDSKRLTASQREKLARLILEECFVGLSFVSPRTIDSIGIVPATQLAMRRAVAGLLFTPDFLLVDGMDLPEAPCPSRPVIHGDRLSISIAAASIVAKVTRDRYMSEMDVVHQGYAFRTNKGYLTSQHRAALDQLGPTPIHRFSFAPVRSS